MITTTYIFYFSTLNSDNILGNIIGPDILNDDKHVIVLVSVV